MEIAIAFIKGLGVIGGWALYTVLFNVAWTKVTGESFEGGSNNILGQLLGPTLLTIAAVCIILVLCQIGQEF